MQGARQVPTEPAHHTWDAGHEPVLAIASGDTIVVETREVSDDQITPASTAADLTAIDPSRLYPLSGPVLVEDARAGDTLAVEVLEIEVADWGWAGIVPGEGLLPDDFPDPYLRIFALRDGRETNLRDDVAIPLDPFLGVMGTCPADARGLAVMPPGGFGGNLDVYAAAQDAVRSMIDHLVHAYALSPEDAYVLCSLVVDLTISEVVDAGIYVVSALLPLSVVGESTT